MMPAMPPGSSCGGWDIEVGDEELDDSSLKGLEKHKKQKKQKTKNTKKHKKHKSKTKNTKKHKQNKQNTKNTKTQKTKKCVVFVFFVLRLRHCSIRPASQPGARTSSMRGKAAWRRPPLDALPAESPAFPRRRRGSTTHRPAWRGRARGQISTRGTGNLAAADVERQQPRGRICTHSHTKHNLLPSSIHRAPMKKNNKKI